MSGKIEKRLLKSIQKKLSDKFGTEVIIYSNSYVGGGCINNASKLETSEGTFFLKWNAHCAYDLFLRESESLNELNSKENPYVSIPKVIAVKELDSTPGFIILEYLDSGHSNNSSDENLGKGLATIHKITNNNFGFNNNNYCGATVQNNSWNNSWSDFFAQQRIWHLVNLIRHERGMPSDHLRLYERLVSRISDILPSDNPPALIHGDLWSGNYMHTTNGPALIDPASYYADREMEMGIMTMFGGFSARFWGGYNEIYPLPADWRDRNKIYQLYHVLNHYYLFGGGYGSQALDIVRRYV